MDSAVDALPGYRIGETLGQGGHGTVHRARQLAVGREVALRIDDRRLPDDRDRRRFLREVTAAGRLSGHPHVVAVYDAGVLPDGRPYMALELCPNGSLADRLRDRGPFPATEVRDIGAHIGDALVAAHAAGVPHGAVRPANILVNRYGGVALAGFGLAALPRHASARPETPTPAYGLPEVAEPTEAGDVHALAATLYALLSGGPPSVGATAAAQVPGIPGAPPGLVAVLSRVLAHDPADRPADMAAFRAALTDADLSSAEGVPPAYWPGPTSPAAEHRAPAAPSDPARRDGLGGAPLAAVAAVAIAAAGVLLACSIGGQSRAASAAGTAAHQGEDPYGGARTTARNCPAAGVRGARARCVSAAECWSGIVSANGDLVIHRADCGAGHSYETFAIAPLPADGRTWDEHTLHEHPLVRRLCSRDVMARSRYGDALRYPPAAWSIEVVPPSPVRYESRGRRTFRCVATITGLRVRGSLFRPRS